MVPHRRVSGRRHRSSGGQARVTPLEAEDINVKFTLPSGRKVWWPATVEKIEEGSEKSEILADGVVVYHSAFSYARERVKVQLLANRTVRSEVTTWTEGTWKYPDEDASVGVKKSKKTRTGEEKPEMADEEPEWVDANERCGSDNVATETLADPGVAATSLEQVEHLMKHQFKEIVEKELRRSRKMSDHAGLIE